MEWSRGLLKRRAFLASSAFAGGHTIPLTLRERERPPDIRGLSCARSQTLLRGLQRRRRRILLTHEPPFTRPSANLSPPREGRGQGEGRPRRFKGAMLAKSPRRSLHEGEGRGEGKKDTARRHTVPSDRANGPFPERQDRIASLMTLRSQLCTVQLTATNTPSLRLYVECFP